MKSMKVKVLAAVLPLVVSVTSVGAEGPGDKVTWENLGSFAASNARYVKGPVKGIVVDHHGLGCRFFKIEKPEEFAKEWTARGIVFLHPHTNPWCWMNDQAIAMTDEIVDAVIAHFGLAKDVKVLSTGGSMGGLGALVWTRYTKHHVVACAVNCPVCDLEYHTTERPDVIRSVKSAFGTAPDFAEAVRRHSPLRIAAELPDIPYFFVHADSDTAVNKGAHSDKLVPLLRSLGRKVAYVTSVGKNHCELTDESRAAWERARFAPFEERPEGSRDLRYFNVVPIQGGNVEFAAQEVKRQRALGVKAIAVSLSYHPQCTPAKNLLPIHAANFRRLKELLEDTDVEIGVLIQSTAGHGWNGKVQLSKEPWQHAVYADGKTNPRWCQLDPGFRAYVLEAFRSISREKPSFLLIDDDFGPKHREGFCPLHVARYNAAAGVNRTADEWRQLANDGDQQDPLRRQMEESRRRVPIEFAKEIRAAIDSVDPTIRCGMCTPGAGAGFTKEVALALAGPNTRPFVRIFNAVYGQQNPTCFLAQLQHLRQLEGMMDGIGELVAEADTWPQNHWSEPARYYAAHLIFDVLYGLDGAKLWMSEFERPRDVGSQARYEKVFSDELPKRQALYDLMQTQHPKFHGVTGVINWGRDVCDSTRGGDWDHGTPVNAIFMPFGFPCEIVKTSVRDPRNVWALTRNSVKVMTDDEIRAVLGHRAYVDAIAAKDLTKRGFANLLGVEATDGDENFYYNIEIPADGSDVLKLMSDSSSAFLKPVSDKVETLSRFAYRDPFMKAPDVKSPGLTYFRNELGGEVAVAGWTFENAGFNYMTWAKYTKVARKEQLVKVMDRLSGGLMPFVACENNHAISTWATLDDDSTLFTMTNLSIDDWRDLRVRLDAVPASAKLLEDDGTWRPVAAEKTGAHEVTFRVGEVRCLKPQILLVR